MTEVRLFDNRIARETRQILESGCESFGSDTNLTMIDRDIRVPAPFFDNGEFDPGSERTLAAWIRHASRTRTGELGNKGSLLEWRKGE